MKHREVFLFWITVYYPNTAQLMIERVISIRDDLYRSHGDFECLSHPSLTEVLEVNDSMSSETSKCRGSS